MLFYVIRKEFKNATPKALEYLEDPDFDVNAYMPGYWNDCSLFMEVVKGCCKHGNFTVFDKMIKDPRLDVNHIACNANALFYAMEGKCVKTFRRLFNIPGIKLFPFENMKDQFHNFNIVYCAAYYSADILEFLIEDGRVDVEKHIEAATRKAVLRYGDPKSLKVIVAHYACVIANTPRLMNHLIKESKDTYFFNVNDDRHATLARIIREIKKDPVGLMKQMRLELGYSERDAAMLFIACQKSGMRITNEKDKKFFAVARRLPLELQMRLCNLAFSVNKEFIKGSDIEYVLDSLKTQK